MSTNETFMNIFSKLSPENDILSCLNLNDIINKEDKNTIQNNKSSFMSSNKSSGSFDLIDEEELVQEIKGLLVDIGKIFNSKDQFIINTSDNTLKDVEKETIDLTIFNDPLEFIRLKESNLSFEYRNNKYHNICLLKNYSINNKIIYNVFDFNERKILYSNMHKQNLKVTCLTAFDDIVLGGYSTGIIKLFSCETEKEIKNYSIHQETGAVIALDCTDDANYVIAGYRSGYVILWNITLPQPIKVIDDLINLQTNSKNNSIIAIKFIKYKPRQSYCFICSDESGKLRKITITEGLFRKSVQIDLLISLEYPFFSLKVMRFTEEEQTNYSHVKLIKTAVAVLGNVEGVRILFISLEEKESVSQWNLFTVEEGLNYQTQDASFGIGYTYLYNDNDNNSLIQKPITNKGTSKINNGNVIDYSKEQILLAISIDKFIFLYIVPVENNEINSIMLVGKYKTNNTIIRLGFVSVSLVYYFNKDKVVNIINTKEILTIDSGDNNISNSKFSKAMKEKNKKYSKRMNNIMIADIEKTSVIIDSNKSLLRRHYHNYIIAYPRKLFIMTKSTFHAINLFVWKDCLDIMKKSEQWEEALCLGIDIYWGRITTLDNIPNESAKRKEELGLYLKQLLEEYIDTQLKGLNNLIFKENEEERQELIINLIKYSIEFCLEIESVNQLIKTIQPKYFKDNKLIFFETLELFIFDDKLSQIKLDNDTIETIVTPYIEKKEFQMFSKIISFLDKDTICNNEFITKTCKDNNIITAMIYISANKRKEDYFLPLQQIYHKFLLSSEINWEKFKGYSHFVSQSSMNSLEDSKQYTGHKLLWYSDLCIKGKTYQKMNNMTESKHKEVVQKIYCYLFSTNVINILLDFDSFSYFKVLSKLYTNEKVFEMINSMNQQTYEKIISEYKIRYYYDTNLFSIKDIKVILMAQQLCKEKDNFYLNHDFNEFLITISLIITIDKKTLLDAIKSILSYDQNLKNLPPEKKIDRFNCHMQLSMPNSQYVKDLSDKINKVIDSLSDLSVQECNELLEVSTLSQFLWVKIHLLKRNSEYLHCVETYLTFEVKEQRKEVFEFIIATFEDLKIKAYEKFIEFKAGVLNYFDQLADIVFEELAKLTYDWYDQEKEFIVHKLDNRPLLQSKYLETIITSKFKEIELNDHSDISYEMEQMLLFQIELLIKIDKKEQILKNFKERRFYPLKKCLKLCLDNSVKDAAIFIYQQLGSHMEALILSCSELKEIFLNIKKCLTKSHSQDNQWIIIIEDLRRNICQSESICQNYSDMIMNNNSTDNNNEIEKNEEDHELWLTLLNELYLLLDKLENEDNDVELKAIKLTLSVEIENVLKAMCSFVSIQKILNNVTEKSKCAEFKEFKFLLTKITSMFYNMSNVLGSVKTLLSHSITYYVTDFKRLNNKGGCIKIDKCSVCNKLFKQNSGEVILIFKCTHSSHYNCGIKQDDDILCKVCRMNEVNEEIDSNKKNTSLVPKKNSEVKYNDFEKKTIKKEEILLKRLANMNKAYLNILSQIK